MPVLARTWRETRFIVRRSLRDRSRLAKGQRPAISLVAALALAGCSTLHDPLRSQLDAPESRVCECAGWFLALDRETDAAGVRDAQDARISGFPYLRANRLLASYRTEADLSESAFEALVGRMRDLDLAARRHEISNLPAERLRMLPGPAPDGARGEALGRSGECGQVLREHDAATPGSQAALLQRAMVPDEYRTWQRALGLYPLTRYPFAAGVRGWEDEVRAAYRRELPPAGGVLTRLSPPAGAALPYPSAAAILARAVANPLGFPDPPEQELEALFAAHAPSFEIDVQGDHDRFGELRWLRDSESPAVDVSRQVVYRHAAATRYRGRTLLQLVYVIWFPERPPIGAFDILAGRLDGVIWRVTLAPDGEPLLYDTIHPCGCFHMFYPTPRATARPAPDGLQEWLLIPQAPPRVAAGERTRLRIASRTHYVERVSLVRDSDNPVRYEVRQLDALRSLTRPDDGSASAFGPDGLVAGTARAERFLFWPMGIQSQGAMRQWGKHATAFVGRRHFDDPDLLEKRFLLELP